MDEKGAEIAGGDANGALCLKTPWPGIARTVYGDHRRFVETYFAPFPGYYFTGDGGHRDNAGYFQGSESVSLPLSNWIMIMWRKVRCFSGIFEPPPGQALPGKGAKIPPIHLTFRKKIQTLIIA